MKSDPAWRFALGAYLFARIALSGWLLLVSWLMPTALQNLDLFGASVLAVFDVGTSERYAFSRTLEGTTFAFRAGARGQVVDVQTTSTWSLVDGRAIAGKLAGWVLAPSAFPVEEIFPYRGVAPQSCGLLAVWQRFDTNWYLAIAERGYSDDGSSVYLPLYPSLIRVIGWVIGNRLLAALLISNLALIGAIGLLYHECARLFDLRTARRTIAYLLLFASAFFLMAAYTESLFLLLCLGALAFARRERWLLAGLCGALAALTRLQGVLLIVPLAYMGLKSVGVWGCESNRPQPPPTRDYSILSSRYVLPFAPLVLIPLATLAFLAITNLSLLTSYEGQLHAKFVLPWENIWAALTLVASGQGSFVDLLNLVATIIFGAMVVVVWRKMPREYGLYAAAMFLAPLFRMTTMQPLVSMTRYVLVLFPVFMLWGVWGKSVWMNRAVLYIGFPLQLYLSAQFALWGWVG